MVGLLFSSCQSQTTSSNYRHSSQWCVTPTGFLTNMKIYRCSAQNGRSFARLYAAKSYAASLSTDTIQPQATRAPNKPKELEITSSGSGFFISRRGELITNDHVI